MTKALIEALEAAARQAAAAEVEKMHAEGSPICMREGETTWRTYHAGFDLSIFASRVVDAALSAARAAPVAEVPAGWKLVPEELTKEMIRAAFDSGFEGNEEHLRADYKAMLAKAPLPPGWLARDVSNAAQRSKELAAAPDAPTTGWRTMESAPHDELVLLTWRDNLHNKWMYEAAFASFGWRRGDVSNVSRHGHATHWHSLPAPPKDQGGAK